MVRLFVSLFAVLILGVNLLWAEVPLLMNYQGTLHDNQGDPITGTVTIRFGLYAASSGGSPLWEEEHASVFVTQGVFHVLLGSVTPISPATFAESSRWLATRVNGEDLTPRRQIASEPYAFRAAVADSTANGKWVQAGNSISNTNSGNVGIGTSTPGARLHVSQSSNVDYAAHVYNGGGNGRGLMIAAGDYGSNPNPLLWIGDGTGLNPVMQVRAGISPHVEVAGTGRFTGPGGFSIGDDAGQNRIMDTGPGLLPFSFLNAANSFAGIRVRSASVGGSYAGTNAPPDDGMIVQGNVGIGTTNPQDRLHVVTGGAIRVENTASGDQGHYGPGAAELLASTPLIDFKNNAEADFDARLILDQEDRLTVASDDGNVTLRVEGTLTVTGTKNFQIDHPLAPRDRYLNHASVESSEILNLYTGNAVLDESGEAWVELPAWFEALNRDFRYQLTCIGGFAPVYVAEKIRDLRFKIAGGTPGLEVSWQVTGVRHDTAALANPLVVEVDKPVGAVAASNAP